VDGIKINLVETGFMLRIVPLTGSFEHRDNMSSTVKEEMLDWLSFTPLRQYTLADDTKNT
jgi:hypothetical protein